MAIFTKYQLQYIEVNCNEQVSVLICLTLHIQHLFNNVYKRINVYSVYQLEKCLLVFHVHIKNRSKIVNPFEKKRHISDTGLPTTNYLTFVSRVT